MRTNKPVPLSEIGKEYLSSLGVGFLRGMTLKIYKAKIKELVGTKEFAPYIKGEKLVGDDANPKLIIYCKQPWRTELHNRRYQLKKLINDRLETEFISEVRINPA